MKYEFPVPKAINLDARLGFGSISIHAVDDLEIATVTLTAAEPDSDVAQRTAVEMNGRTLTIRARKPRNTPFDLPVLMGRATTRDAMDVEVSVPSGTAMKVTSYGADLSVDGRSGSADIGAGSTSIRLEDVDGDLRLRFGTGPARVGRVRGCAALRFGAGEAQLGEIDGTVAMTCGSGSLAVAVAHGSVRARTGSGRASVGCAYADVDLTSGSGGLEVGLPPGLSARLDVITGGGRLQSDLDVQDIAPHGSTITIRARTGNGDVHLFRAVS